MIPKRPVQLAAGWLAVLCAATGVAGVPARGGAQEDTASGEGEPAPLAVPWRERRRAELGVYRREEARIGPADWAAEPISPPTESLDGARFAAAIRQLCGRMRESRAVELAGSILRHADAFDIDPFLLGGLIHQQSHCKRAEEHQAGVGLTRLPWRMHTRDFRRGVYRYWVRGPDGWIAVEQTLDAFPFTGAQLRRADPNVYFAAGILKVLQTQHDSIHQAFPEQVLHRHYVSHFVWGDQVRSSRAEDRILSERRRLMQYYGIYTPPAPLVFRGMEISAPLDGAPRVIMSWLGARRERTGGGRRPHRGTDLESYPDEPVRAVAAGRVVVAGVDLPGAAHEENLSWRRIMQVERRTLGPGGRYVCVQHDPPELPDRTEGGEDPPRDDGTARTAGNESPQAGTGAQTEDAPTPNRDRFRTCYMHLERVWVRRGAEVERGALLGTVGRTGIRNSAAHLHFEMRDPHVRLDPAEVLAGQLVGHRPRRRSWW